MSVTLLPFVSLFKQTTFNRWEKDMSILTLTQYDPGYAHTCSTIQETDVSFSCVCSCPGIHHEFRHNSLVKVAVDPRGDGQ